MCTFPTAHRRIGCKSLVLVVAVISMICTVAGCGGKDNDGVIASATRGQCWSKDGQAVYYTTAGGSGTTRVWRYDLRTKRKTSWVVPSDFGEFDVSPDGKSIVFTDLTTRGTPDCPAYPYLDVKTFTLAAGKKPKRIYRTLHQLLQVRWLAPNLIVFGQAPDDESGEGGGLYRLNYGDFSTALIKGAGTAEAYYGSDGDGFVYTGNDRHCYYRKLAGGDPMPLGIGSAVRIVYVSKRQVVYYDPERRRAASLNLASGPETPISIDMAGYATVSPDLRAYFVSTMPRGEWSRQALLVRSIPKGEQAKLMALERGDYSSKTGTKRTAH